MEKQLELLGWQVKDKVTGFVGVVNHVGLDLYGCVQALVQPKVTTDKDGVQKQADTLWFDAARLVKQGNRPIMAPIPMKGDAIVAGPDNYKPAK